MLTTKLFLLSGLPGKLIRKLRVKRVRQVSTGTIYIIIVYLLIFTTWSCKYIIFVAIIVKNSRGGGNSPIHLHASHYMHLSELDEFLTAIEARSNVLIFTAVTRKGDCQRNIKLLGLNSRSSIAQ